MTWQAEQTLLLTEELESVLAVVASTDKGLERLVREPLSIPRRALFTGAVSDVPWPLIPMMVCQAIKGEYHPALPLAAAMQLLLAAGDVFDDAEDADSPGSLAAMHGPAIATNVGTLLVILAEGALAGLKARGVVDAVIVRVIAALNSYYTTACIGQHADLCMSPGAWISEEYYFKLIGMKSASQIECACHTGAMLATAEPVLIDAMTEFGRNLGLASQITNDIRGITGGKDIVQRKTTLPVIVALGQAQKAAADELAAAFNRHTRTAPDVSRIRELITTSGALYYSTVKAEMLKQAALAALGSAAEAGASVEHLQIFFS